MGFIHLHNQSTFSINRGTMSVVRLVRMAKKCGMNAVALTDYLTMSGALEFYYEAGKEGIKPIIGQEFLVTQDESAYDTSAREDTSSHSLILLAENETGYKNLLKLSTLSSLASPPHVSVDAIDTYHDGLIALSGGIEGLIPALILDNRKEEARHAAETLHRIFGHDHFYLELQDHGKEEQTRVNAGLTAISAELRIGLVASNGCCFPTKDDAEANSLFRSIRGIEAASDQCYFKTGQEMELLFAGCPEARRATQQIADRCTLTLPLFKEELPLFSVPDGFTSDAYLRHLVRKGSQKRFPDGVTSAAQTRIDDELSFIASRGFADYFLIVQDYISYARRQGIMVGPGRGSAPGSFVCFCLGITQIDPLKYGLLFERFLCHTRSELPDIDVDVCAHRRGEILRYLCDTYGADHVAEGMEYQPCLPSDIVKIAEAMTFPKEHAQMLSDAASSIYYMDCPTFIAETSAAWKKLFRSGEKEKHFADTVCRLDDAITSCQKDGRGIVISRQPLTHSVPLSLGQDPEIPVISFNRWNVNAAGLVIFDLSGMETLSTIDRCVQLIRVKSPDFNLSAIPRDDPAAFALCHRGDTAGVFLCDDSSLHKLVLKLKPDCIENLSALIALSRPGPMQSGIADGYIDCKKHPAKIDYYHPCLEPVLRDSYGVIIYQEQIMRIARIMGNFSIGESDRLRKAMSKKKIDLIDEMKQQFLSGAEKLGFNASLAEKVYDRMSWYGEYTFNKSHAVAYAHICYQTAYLKANFHEEWMEVQ